jgi:RNA polymerase sigma-70 factor (ECF subfamily)
MLHLTKLLAELVPTAGEAFALAALVRYAEARRPARLSGDGVMVPLAEQDPARFRRELIEEADALFARATEIAPLRSRTLQAALQRVWCARRSLTEAPPWSEALRIYDRLLAVRDDGIVRLNRAVALAEVEGAEAALRELEPLASQAMAEFLPYHAVRADLLRRTGRLAEARAAYAAAMALDPPPAERRWLERKVAGFPSL